MLNNMVFSAPSSTVTSGDNAIVDKASMTYVSTVSAFLHLYITICTICVIIIRGLFILHPIFHCGLYCRAVSITNNLCTKQGNSSIFERKISGLYVYIYKP